MQGESAVHGDTAGLRRHAEPLLQQGAGDAAMQGHIPEQALRGNAHRPQRDQPLHEGLPRVDRGRVSPAGGRARLLR